MFPDDEPRVLKRFPSLPATEKTQWEMGFAPGDQAALELLAQKLFEGIVSGIRMPGWGGAKAPRHPPSECAAREQAPEADSGRYRPCGGGKINLLGGLRGRKPVCEPRASLFGMVVEGADSPAVHQLSRFVDNVDSFRPT